MSDRGPALLNVGAGAVLNLTYSILYRGLFTSISKTLIPMHTLPMCVRADCITTYSGFNFGLGTMKIVMSEVYFLRRELGSKYPGRYIETK